MFSSCKKWRKRDRGCIWGKRWEKGVACLCLLKKVSNGGGELLELLFPLALGIRFGIKSTDLDYILWTKLGGGRVHVHLFVCEIESSLKWRWCKEREIRMNIPFLGKGKYDTRGAGKF